MSDDYLVGRLDGYKIASDRTAQQPADLDAIRRRAEAATEGPLLFGLTPEGESFTAWVAKLVVDTSVSESRGWVVWADEQRDGADFLVVAVTGNGPTSQANAEFIAHARSDIPALLDHVDALTREEERLRRAIQGHCARNDGFADIDPVELLQAAAKDWFAKVMQEHARAEAAEARVGTLTFQRDALNGTVSALQERVDALTRVVDTTKSALLDIRSALDDYEVTNLQIEGMVDDALAVLDGEPGEHTQNEQDDECWSPDMRMADDGERLEPVPCGTCPPCQKSVAGEPGETP